MSFMTFIIFSWILFITIFSIYDLFLFDSDVDIFYMIKQEKQKRQQNDDISQIMFAYTAVIAAIVLPQMNQID
jgi:predicted RND superfamily exporter protein